MKEQKMLSDWNPNVNIDVDFTDEKLTCGGGWVFLAKLAKELDLFRRFARAAPVKLRRRGACDGQIMWSLVALLARGLGKLSDLDHLRDNETDKRLLGLDECPGSRRAGEWLKRLNPEHIEGFQEVGRHVAKVVVRLVIDYEVAKRGYVPVFVDGTRIEVGGALFEGASRQNYSGERSLWLHSVFVGTAWVSARLHPGDASVTVGWKEQLLQDVVPLIPKGTPVRLVADNAYYKGDMVRLCREQGWEYSISVTNGNNKGPVLEQIEGLPEHAWTDLGCGEEATLVTHCPQRWDDQHYAVIRRRIDPHGQQLFFANTVILVSDGNQPVEEAVHHHRAKQGQENAMKFPLIDMGLHHPRCGSLNANRGHYHCAQIAQLLMTFLKLALLPEVAQGRGLYSVMRYFIGSVGKLVKSGHRLQLRLAKNNAHLEWLSSAVERLSGDDWFPQLE